VYNKVKVLAGLDAAIFGSAFGVNYYMPRNNNTFNVELTNVEFEDLSFVSSPRAINAVALAFTNSNAINSTINIGNGYPFVYAAGGAVDGWRSADQQINIAYSSYFPHFNFGFWANTAPTAINGVQFFNPPSLFMFPELVQVIQVFDTATGYALSTGAWTANASVYKIDATILGADKVRPYECIKFDNTVPLRYQGKHFRPTSLSYDLKADKVKVTAYQIDTFVPPVGNIVVNIGDCESGDMVALFTYNTFTNIFTDETGENTSNQLTFNAFTNVFADETGENTVNLDAFTSAVDAFSSADGGLSNVTGISL
jgi:hypothetical protein